MNTSRIRLALVLALSLSTACVGETFDQLPFGIGASCGAAQPCAAGLECEVEHGVGTCQPHGGDAGARHDSASADRPSADAAASANVGASCGAAQPCAAGLECEVEHGVGTCRPHGGGGVRGDGGAPADVVSADRSPADAAPVADAGASCTADTDCAAGLECEVEHGVGTCQPHGRRGRD